MNITKERANTVGGITTNKGITFVGEKTRIVINDKDGTYKVSKWSNPALKKKSDVPFLRGFVKLYSTLKMGLTTTIGKFSAIFLAIALLSVITGLIRGESMSASQMSLLDTFISITINITIICAMMFYGYNIRPLHGLEHKLISAYKQYKPLTVKNVKSMTKETPYCGGTLLGIIFAMNILISIFNLPVILLWILVPSLGIELFILARGNKWYNKMIFFPGWLIQQITTSDNVSDQTIEKYLVGFKVFVNNELK